MLSIQIPSQSFGKAASEHRSGYQILISAPELQPLTAFIESSLRFQWLSQPEREADRYPAVWYFHPIDEQRGLLYYFEDQGSDPRPHVLRRVVGLCQRDEHEDFLSALASGHVASQELDTKGQWDLRLDAPQRSASFVWKSQFLHRGDPTTYDLSTRHIPPPALIKKAQASPLLSPPPSRMKPLYTHLICLLIGMVITLLLYPRAKSTSAPAPATQAPESSAQDNAQHQQELAVAYDSMRKQAQHLRDSLTAMQQLCDVYRQSMERFKSEHADRLTTEQLDELTELINRLTLLWNR